MIIARHKDGGTLCNIQYLNYKILNELSKMLFEIN